jgi:anhydro-N-acetylmuramic acid kinase
VYHDGPRATLQIGEMAYVRAATGLPVVNNFRSGDLAVGGQGAPIASLFHMKILAPLTLKWLRGQPKRPTKIGPKSSRTKSSDPKAVAVHNLGGISNLTWIKGGKLLAFDTGPANMLVDLFVQKHSRQTMLFDKGGQLASQGVANPQVLQKLMEHKFFKQRPPKSCGREQFGEPFLQQALASMSGESPANIAATLTELTAASVERAYRHHVPSLPAVIVVCGGGARNTYLLGRLRFRLPECQIVTSDLFGWPTQSIEGAAFALLTAYRLRERPANLPATTGARRPALLGQIS